MSRNTMPIWQKAVAVFAVLFGLLTLFKSGGILFDMEGAKEAAGVYVPFVVQFNFVAGFFYILAGVGIWFGLRWACPLSGLIVLATLLAAAAFAFHISQGGGYEVKTAAALAVRAGFWAVVAVTLRRRRE